MDRMMEKLRVLVVDDNHHMIKIVRTILRSFGITDFREAFDSASAFRIVRSTPIDLIVTDYALPPANGCELTKLVRTARDSPNHFVPIIMLTAYGARSKVEEARDAGVTEFCVKPITPIGLYQKVAAVINSPRAFVRTKAYFGPDRRRRKTDRYKGAERREACSGPNGADIPGNSTDVAA